MFGESAILDDGRVITARASGIDIGPVHFAGPSLRFPDACLVDGEIWLAAKGQDGGGFVWRESRPLTWMPVPKPVYGMRMIIRPVADDYVLAAYTISANYFREVCVFGDGTISVTLDNMFIPTGEGAHGMRDFDNGFPQPLAPLDEIVNGRPVRAVIAHKIAASRYAPDQVVLVPSLATLALDLVNYATLRVSTNRQFWCGTAYATPPRIHSGPLPLDHIIRQGTGHITI